MSSAESQQIWTRAEAYHNSFLIPKDEVLDKIVENSRANGLLNISVSAAQGKFLHLLARSIGAKKILEVGTLGGYSTTWFARAVPEDGAVTTLEVDPQCVRVATENLATAGLVHKVEIILGPAAETLETLSPTPIPFDLVFIDADKEGNATYFKHAKRLVRKGGIIIVDNVVRDGKVADLENKDSMVEGARRLLEVLKADPEVSATTISTVGEKGYDGFTFALKL
ncbi:O-methyltransferase family 3 protein [Thelephora ganbajun]|uniref:O-methyltransferase family 3 protein n=1 Tax=Thelephora ganbajun TaxID=370292 RepID=A0ACB6ZSD2_THEGA|nr:O-methyltransferase family 3 protein [Thelephora ganbajun]